MYLKPTIYYVNNLMPILLSPGWYIDLRTGVGGDDLNYIAHLHFLNRFFSLLNWKGAA